MLIDSVLLFRSLQLKRTDCLANISTLYVLLAIRHLNKIKDTTNCLSIYILLKNNRRSSAFGHIAASVKTLMVNGLVTGKTAYRITEAGKQALINIDKELKQARYKYGKQKALKKPGNRPKPII